MGNDGKQIILSYARERFEFDEPCILCFDVATGERLRRIDTDARVVAFSFSRNARSLALAFDYQVQFLRLATITPTVSWSWAIKQPFGRKCESNSIHDVVHSPYTDAVIVVDC